MVNKDQAIEHLGEVLAEFSTSMKIAERLAATWKKKAYYLKGKSFVIHEADGTPLAVLVALAMPPPYQFTNVDEGADFAGKLGIGLSIAVADEKVPVVSIKAADLPNEVLKWRPYVGPAGLVLDFARNA